MFYLELTELPFSLRPIEHLLNTAKQYEKRDVVVYYWCLFRAAQSAMKLDKSSKQAIEFLDCLLSIMEKIKAQNLDCEALNQDIAAEAHIEDRAQKLLSYANSQDSQGVFNLNLVKAFYTSSCLLDVLEIWCNDANIRSAMKYAKWRATYINNCLKNGGVPIRSESKGPEQVAVTFQLPNQISKSFGPIKPVSSPPLVNRQSKPVPHLVSSSSVGRDDKVGVASAQLFTPTPSTFLDSVANSDPLVALQPDNGEPSLDLTLDDFIEARKFIKYAMSALDYDDARAAIENLHKAVAVLKKR